MKKWIALAIVLLLLALLPILASTRLGKPLFETAIGKQLGAKVEIGSVRLSWLGPQVFKQVRLVNPDYTGTIEELDSSVPFWALLQFSQKAELKNGVFTFKEGSVEEVNGQIQGHQLNLTGITRQGASKGHIALNGSVFSKNHFDIHIDLDKMPGAALDRLLGAKGSLEKILGSSVNAKGALNFEDSEGSIDLDIASSNLKTALKGDLKERGLTLRSPLRAALTLNEELSESLLSEINPLFLTSISAKNPILLQIASQGFFFPLNPFSVARLQIGQGTLEMGQVRLGNGKTLASLVNLLKANPFADARAMNAWFTPLSFQIEDGILKAGRLDALLADSIHICTWGDVDLNRDQIHMFLGLPADTLARSFGIQRLHPDFVLKIPITGSPRKPELETGPAAAKIAALVASQRIPKKGKVFGDIFNVFVQAKEDSDAPPPRRPFPWE